MSDKQAAPSLPPLIGGGGNNGSATQQQQQQQTVRLQQVLATAQGLNVLTTGGGQQFVITSQVPGLAQVNNNNLYIVALSNPRNYSNDDKYHVDK